METTKSINDYANKHLGQAGSYAVKTDKFDPTLLVQMPRDLARKDWGITGSEFVGIDTWHCHEATFLLNSGMPVAGTIKLMYPSSTEFMVESKSIKLYLNSFDMCKMGSTIREGVMNYVNQIKKDLSTLLGVTVQVAFFENGSQERSFNPTTGYVDLINLLGESTVEKIPVTDYSSEKIHVKFESSNKDEVYNLSTNILRSRCRHTGQKDTGSVYIYLKTKNAKLDLESLLLQIISYRESNEFHEFICETLYTSLMKSGVVEECSVMMLYSRRGSWDINPQRCSKPELINPVLSDVTRYTDKTMGQ